MSRILRNLIITVVIILIAGFIAWPDSPGIHFGDFNKDFQTRLGLDLVGGVQALLEADLPEGSSVDTEAMRTATTIVENRVNGLGVTEAVVQQAGDTRIVVELPGETDPEAALDVLKKTGLLEFVDLSSLSAQEAALLAETQVEIQTDFGLEESQSTIDGTVVVTPTQTITATQTITPTDQLTGELNRLTSQVYPTVMTGAELRTIQVTTDPTTGEPQVAFTLTQDGTGVFADFTRDHVGDVLAIVLDKKIVSAPVINQPIPDGQGVISGNFDIDSANALAVQLRYGSLPIPLKVVEVRTVGPTLGQDSLRKSLVAGAVGFAIVILFMGLYYRLPGAVADFSILIYALIAFAVFRFVPVTLTLPGVAGFLLSTGSALDANILIFERLKEELRSGKALRQSVELGFQRALPAIRDSNIATLITCAILFWFGSTFGATIVKGFSITLAVGVVISLFTALFITRTIMRLILERFDSTDYSKWFGL